MRLSSSTRTTEEEKEATAKRTPTSISAPPASALSSSLSVRRSRGRREREALPPRARALESWDASVRARRGGTMKRFVPSFFSVARQVCECG